MIPLHCSTLISTQPNTLLIWLPFNHICQSSVYPCWLLMTQNTLRFHLSQIPTWHLCSTWKWMKPFTGWAGMTCHVSAALCTIAHTPKFHWLVNMVQNTKCIIMQMIYYSISLIFPSLYPKYIQAFTRLLNSLVIKSTGVILSWFPWISTFTYFGLNITK